MDGKRTYSIVINGVKESTDAVLALNRMLNELENRIQALEKNNIKISGDKSNAGDLKEQVALQKELNQLKKEEAAQQRLAADAYANTMKGMKQNLADLKTVINTTDLGETDSIKNMTKDANELTNKLKKMEEAYGQFGRNVGNYANGVAEGLQKVTINVGGVERTFANARDASRQLGNELKTMAINGEQGTKAFKDMQVAVAKLNSDIKDATVSSKAMDNLLDTMQSIASIGSITQGFSALFGFDDDEIEKSIQKLVALQNVMQGIEKINQQINSQEGIGGWLAKGNSMIDSFVAKITGANKAQEALNVSTKAGVTASKELAVAQEGQAVATTTATVATKALSVALKTIGIGLIISAVATLITYWKDIYNWFTDTIPALKNLSTWFDKLKAVAIGTGTAIINFLVQPIITLAKVIQDVINGDFSKIGSDIVNGLKKQYNVIGNFRDGYYKETERQQQAHNEKMNEQQRKANEEWLKDEEAKYGSSHKRTQEYLKKQMALTKKGSAEYKELQRKLWEDERKEREEANKKAQADSKKNAKASADVEKEMTQIRINAMKEGLNKTITQLEEERKQRLAKLRENGQYYKKEEEEINRIIDQKILEAKEEHAKAVEKVYKDMWDRINANSLDNTQRTTKMAQESIDIMNQYLKDASNEYFNQSIGSYGVQGKKQLTPTTQFSLGIASENKSELMTEMKEYVDMMRELQTVQNEYNATYHKLTDDFNKLSDEKKGQLNMDLDMTQNYFNKLKKEVDEYESYLKEKYSEDVFQGAKVALFNESYSSDLTSLFEQRISAIEAYWAKRKKYEAENANELYKQQLKQLDEEWKAESAATWNHYQDELKQADEFYEKKLELIKQNLKDGTITTQEAEEEKKELESEYQKASTQMYQNYAYKDEQLRIMHSNNTVKLEQEKNNKLKQTNAEYYQSVLQELRDFQTAQSNLESKQPVKNSWGITNLKETNANYRNLLASYEAMANKIREKRAEVNRDYSNGIIDKDAFDSTIRELDNFSASLGEKMDTVKKKLNVSTQVGQIVQDIQQYVQVLGQSVQQLMSSIWDYQDYMFDKEQDELDKWNEELNDALKEQQDIIEEHKDAVDSIEDELATARGDRRQHLIDQLNAEISAQRAAQKEEQRIQKEQEAAKKKEEALEKKRREAEYKRNVMQAFVSWHLSIANGLATQPFLPVGIAMGALATALGAVQYALVKSQKPYAKGGQLDGGVAQGKRHRDGGIPVLGGRASIEGGEFITNRQTTANNVDLLEFVNSKHRKLKIEDFVDFYSSGKAKQNFIKMSPRTKFADGGVVPTLDNTYSFDDRLLEAFEKYADRPSVVSVVDINNKQADVKRVQTLAGL